MKNRSKIRELETICKNTGILALYLFGSMSKEGAAILGNKIPKKVDPLVDIDVGVVFLKRPLSVEERLELYNRLFPPVSDLFSPLPLDLVFLQETGVVLQFEAINGLLIYSRDEDQRMEYEERVIKFYQDWKPDYDLYIEEVLEAVSG